ncbi:MAG: hypothetical protein AAFU67_10985 [Bacteroidota bacterium]
MFRSLILSVILSGLTTFQLLAQAGAPLPFSANLELSGNVIATSNAYHNYIGILEGTNDDNWRVYPELAEAGEKITISRGPTGTPIVIMVVLRTTNGQPVVQRSYEMGEGQSSVYFRLPKGGVTGLCGNFDLLIRSDEGEAVFPITIVGEH